MKHLIYGSAALCLLACGQGSGAASDSKTPDSSQAVLPADSAISAANTEAAKASDEDTYTLLRSRDFSIEHPVSYKQKASGNEQVVLVLISDPSSKDDPFLENINLLVQDLGRKDISLDQYAKISEAQIAEALKFPRIERSERRFDADGNEFHLLEYSGEQGGFKMKFLQTYRIHNKKAYVLTFTAAQQDFERYRAGGEKMLNSFKLN